MFKSINKLGLIICFIFVIGVLAPIYASGHASHQGTHMQSPPSQQDATHQTLYTFRQSLGPTGYKAYEDEFMKTCHAGCDTKGPKEDYSKCKNYCNCLMNTIGASTYTADKVEEDLKLYHAGDTSNALYYIFNWCIDKEIKGFTKDL